MLLYGYECTPYMFLCVYMLLYLYVCNDVWAKEFLYCLVDNKNGSILYTYIYLCEKENIELLSHCIVRFILLLLSRIFNLPHHLKKAQIKIHEELENEKLACICCSPICTWVFCRWGFYKPPLYFETFNSLWKACFNLSSMSSCYITLL